MNRDEKLNHEFVFDRLTQMQQTLVKVLLINYITCHFLTTLY
ncbi:hypothetical protein GPAL_1810 [Glaciecola pallidula DSM 14239 = ACAM 615]|uniref:Uncharacterized protein n=1 Tax=Brumicola pallidula DSM 14239 = ACAM 615 TaxID=1121922 RepID=K6ZE98_9ALTE|nr:hypothetical protein GPAL_1810 [Glaciecola pallidula DSM 14239 = ACAM 615]